jgi:hypothetical protein
MNRSQNIVGIMSYVTVTLEKGVCVRFFAVCEMSIKGPERLCHCRWS